jgi:hypothetical protein
MAATNATIAEVSAGFGEYVGAYCCIATMMAVMPNETIVGRATFG